MPSMKGTIKHLKYIYTEEERWRYLGKEECKHWGPPTKAANLLVNSELFKQQLFKKIFGKNLILLCTIKENRC